jgi:hypothetical protein
MGGAPALLWIGPPTRPGIPYERSGFATPLATLIGGVALGSAKPASARARTGHRRYHAVSLDIERALTYALAMPSNDKRSLKALSPALTSWQSGSVSFAGKLSMPFLEESILGLIEDGFSEEPEIPVGLIDAQKSGPTAVFGVDDAIVVGIAIFLGTAMGQWAVGRICDEIWDKRVGPAFRKLLRRRKQGKGLAEKPLTFSFGAWFDTDTVFVQVIATLQKGESAEGIETLVPEAFRRAQAWLEQHGVQQPVLIYRVRNGELSSFPTLASSVPRG